MDFDAADLLDRLESGDAEQLDAAGFGVVKLDGEGAVTFYNRWESELSGLAPESVIGQRFFVQVAPCTNNFMVAHRYEESETLDETIDYTFTYKLKPTRVRLRMLKRPAGASYLLVQLR